MVDKLLNVVKNNNYITTFLFLHAFFVRNNLTQGNEACT